VSQQKRYRQVRLDLANGDFPVLSADAQLVWFRVLVEPQMHGTIGLMLGSVATLEDLLELSWAPGRVQAAVDELVEAGWLLVDRLTIGLPLAELEPIQNPSQLKGWRRLIGVYRHCDLVTLRFRELANRVEERIEGLPEEKRLAWIDALPEEIAVHIGSQPGRGPDEDPPPGEECVIGNCDATHRVTHPVTHIPAFPAIPAIPAIPAKRSARTREGPRADYGLQIWDAYSRAAAPPREEPSDREAAAIDEWFEAEIPAAFVREVILTAESDPDWLLWYRKRVAERWRSHQRAQAKLMAPAYRPPPGPAIDVPAVLSVLASWLPGNLPDREIWVQRITEAGLDPEAAEGALEEIDLEILGLALNQLHEDQEAELDRRLAAASKKLARRLTAEQVDRNLASLREEIVRDLVGIPVLSLFAVEEAA